MARFDGFLYDVHARLEVTGPELAALRRCALSHYDHKCKSIARRGGWLRGLLVETEWPTAVPDDFEPSPGDGEDAYEAYLTVSVEKSEKRPVFSFTWSQLDTLAKILEMARYGPAAEQALLLPLSALVRTTMREIRAERVLVEAARAGASRPA